MKFIILNFANTPQYIKGQLRLKQSLESVNYTGDFIGYTDYKILNCKSHQEVPYSFKTYALIKAYEDGYDAALWLDSSIWAIKNIQPSLDFIINNGWLFEKTGYKVGQICSDNALNLLGLNREKLFNIDSFSAGFTGLNFKNNKAKLFLEKWHKFSSEGETFKGPWKNNNNEASIDKRVIGHRHDLTMASIIANELDMTIIPPTYMEYYNETPNINCVFLARGM